MRREQSPAVYISGELDALIKNLDSNHKFVKWINSMVDALEENKFAGDLIKKSQIPNVYLAKFKVNNLYRYSHPEGYRSCYMIVNWCPVILDLMSHSEYDRVFKYKTT